MPAIATAATAATFHPFRFRSSSTYVYDIGQTQDPRFNSMEESITQGGYDSIVHRLFLQFLSCLDSNPYPRSHPQFNFSIPYLDVKSSDPLKILFYEGTMSDLMSSTWWSQAPSILCKDVHPMSG